MKRFLLCVALAGVVSLAQAEDFRLNRLFGDHAVLQREKPVWVWGYGADGQPASPFLTDEQSRETVK